MGVVRRDPRHAVTVGTRRLLAISWEMPPLSGPRAVQVTRTLAALPAYGWRSRTICFGPRSDRYQQDHRVSIETLSGGQARLVPVSSPEEWFAVRALWRLAPPLKRWPDEKRVWMPGALAAARLELAAEPADVLVSFAQPWTDHLIGLRLQREHGLPWVAHFSDPWVDSPYFQGGAAARRRAVAWEREVVAAATRVVFVNRHTRDRVMAKYPASWSEKADVVPQAAAPEEPAPPPAWSPQRPMRIVYTGRFYDCLRTPKSFLEALAALRERQPLDGRIAVDFVGAMPGVYERMVARLGLGTIVTFSGRMSPGRARQYAAERADVLLVVDAPGPDGGLFLPSKLIDYLPLHRPILGVTPNSGASAEILGELGYPMVEPQDVPGITRALRALLDAYAGGGLAAAPNHRSVADRFSIAATTAAFAGVLQRAVARR